MVLVIEEICDLLNCAPEEIKDHLVNASNCMKISKNLRWKRVQTTYKNRNAQKHQFRLSDVTWEGSDEILTYGRLKKPWNSTICSFFFTKHRIRIKYPSAPCALEVVGLTGKRYYPVELLEICDDIGDKNLANCFAKLRVNEPPKILKSTIISVWKGPGGTFLTTGTHDGQSAVSLAMDSGGWTPPEEKEEGMQMYSKMM